MAVSILFDGLCRADSRSPSGMSRPDVQIVLMLTVGSIVKKSARQVACELSGEVVLLHLDKALYQEAGLIDVIG